MHAGGGPRPFAVGGPPAFGSVRASAPAYAAGAPPLYQGGKDPSAAVRQPLLDGHGPAPPPLGGQYPAAGAYDAAADDGCQFLEVVPSPGSAAGGLNVFALPRPTDSPDVAPSTGAANCDARFVRMTTNVMPNSESLRRRWHPPLGAVIHPLAKMPHGEDVPVANPGGGGIVRCRRCRTYVNPYVEFTDAGRRWKCNVCGLLNEVPADYFCPLDPSGRRRDAEERPELAKGSVEFIASAEYMVRPPMPPVYFFLIDVSFFSVVSGMLQVTVDTIKACLKKLPGDSRTQIGFLAVDSSLHFFNLKASLSQPQLMVVADLEEPFLPLPDDLLVNLSESQGVVDTLLDSMPAIYAANTNPDSALGPAIKAAYLILSQLGGKLIIFQSTLPSLGPGRLKLRGEDARVYGTDREHILRTAEDPFYKQMAADLSRVQICVDVFAFSDHYSDIASLGTLARYTGGQVNHYPGFRIGRDGDKFSREFARVLVRETGWEAVMRIRCGKGLKISSFHGHFFIRSTDLLAMPAVDCDKAFAIQFSHEETLLTTPTVYLQAALLYGRATLLMSQNGQVYTSSSGERRIRVHTMAIPVVADLGEMYRAADAAAITAVMSKLAIERCLTSRLEDARQMVQTKCIQALREYRGLRHPRYSNRGGVLLFPESLKLYPLFSLALCKTPVLRGGFQEVLIDERSAALFEMMNMPVHRLLKYLYPSFMRIDDMDADCGKVIDGSVKLPRVLPLISKLLDGAGAYLLDDGLRILLWLGRELPPQFQERLLGPAAGIPNLSQVPVIPQDNPLSRQVFAITEELRRENPVYQQVMAIRQGESSRELLLYHNMVEDRSAAGLSYEEFMRHVYNQVQARA
eukprot:SM000076S21840  [mRNA]  locus=s76:425143:430115:- [translate_table: standard]